MEEMTKWIAMIGKSFMAATLKMYRKDFMHANYLKNLNLSHYDVKYNIIF